MTHPHGRLTEALPRLEHHGDMVLLLQALRAEGMGITAPGLTLLIGATLHTYWTYINPYLVAISLLAILVMAHRLPPLREGKHV